MYMSDMHYVCQKIEGESVRTKGRTICNLMKTSIPLLPTITQQISSFNDIIKIRQKVS